MSAAAKGMDIEVRMATIQKILQFAQGLEGNAQDAFAALCCCAAALSRDIGGHSKEQFLDNCGVAWDGTPDGLLEPDERKFDA